MTRPAAIYLRVSDPNSASQTDAHGLQVQEEACRSYDRTAGLETVVTRKGSRC